MKESPSLLNSFWPGSYSRLLASICDGSELFCPERPSLPATVCASKGGRRKGVFSCRAGPRPCRHRRQTLWDGEQGEAGSRPHWMVWVAQLAQKLLHCVLKRKIMDRHKVNGFPFPFTLSSFQILAKFSLLFPLIVLVMFDHKPKYLSSPVKWGEQLFLSLREWFLHAVGTGLSQDA